MIALEITSFVITLSIGGIAIFRIFNDSRKNICSIIMNLMLGGTLFAIINAMGFSLNLNFITGSIITFLGVPRNCFDNSIKVNVWNFLKVK